MDDVHIFEGFGFKFAYPLTWELEDDLVGENGYVSVTSPKGAFWILKKNPVGSNPELIHQDVINTMRMEYQDMEVYRIEKTLFGKTLVGFEMNFYYLDLTNTAMVMTFDYIDACYSIFWQTGDQLIIHADEDIDTQKVFEAMTYSLMQSIATEPQS